MDPTGKMIAAARPVDRHRGYRVTWKDVVVAAFFMRLTLSAISLGSDDAGIWHNFGAQIAWQGLFHLYRTEINFNHPPLPAYWAMIAFEITLHSPRYFAFVFRIPGILADALSCVLLCKIGSYRSLQPRVGATGMKLAAAFAWSPCAILMSGHHGSTDSIYAALCLLAAFCATELASPFATGLALGGAINIKLIPVLLIPVYLLLQRSRSAALKFLGGLAVMTIPFIPVLIGCGRAFHRNAIEYNSLIDYWGVDQILLETQNVKQYAGVGTILLAEYLAMGRYVLFAAILIFALIARRKGMDFYTAGAGTAALFLILTPGFGVQYLIFALPLLFASDRKTAIRFGLLAGAFMFIAYELFWDGRIPIRTVNIASKVHRGPGDLLAVLAWATLVGFIYRIVTRAPISRMDAESTSISQGGTPNMPTLT
jgi:Gpi18-like mannosyltransferase